MDDDGEDDYFDYIPSTVEPGPLVTVGVILFSISCILILPVLVMLRKRKDKRSKGRKYSNFCKESQMKPVQTAHDDSSTASNAKIVNEMSGSANEKKNFDLESNVEATNKEICKERIANRHGHVNSALGQGDWENKTDPKEDTVSTQNKATSETSIFRFGRLLEIAKPDKEFKRIVSLGWPLTMSEVAESICDTLTVIIISHYQGIDALTAYLLVDMFLEITDTLAGGIIDSLDTLCSHAIGNENPRLAGQYIQIATVIYVFCGGTLMVVWIFIMEDIVELLNLSANIVRLCQELTKIMVFVYMQEGLSNIQGSMLDVTDHEVFQAFVEVTENLTGVGAVWFLYANYESFDLFWVGVTQLSIGVLFMITGLSVAMYKGWFAPYFEGIFNSNALKNKVALHHVLHTAIPLGFGSFLEYGEWEVLTFVAAYMGPAEVAAWVILGDLWDILESVTQGLTDAASIRVAKHLGKGNPNTAKEVAYKGLFLGVSLGVLTSTILFIIWHAIPGWYTSDPMLQEMVMDAIPMIALGNILMVFGMVSWDLVGAQGRYKLATGVSLISSWLVTIPLALFFTLYCKFNLMGIIASLVFGYSTSGLMQAYILLCSDWGSISKKIQETNANDSDYYSSSSDSSSSSSSSDSDSSSSDSDSSSSDSDPSLSSSLDSDSDSDSDSDVSSLDLNPDLAPPVLDGKAPDVKLIVLSAPPDEDTEIDVIYPPAPGSPEPSSAEKAHPTPEAPIPVLKLNLDVDPVDNDIPLLLPLTPASALLIPIDPEVVAVPALDTKLMPPPSSEDYPWKSSVK